MVGKVAPVQLVIEDEDLCDDEFLKNQRTIDPRSPEAIKSPKSSAKISTKVVPAPQYIEHLFSPINTTQPAHPETADRE